MSVKFVMVNIENEHYKDEVKIPLQIDRYFFNRNRIDTAVVDAALVMIRSRGCYISTDEIEFVLVHTGKTMVSGYITTNGQPQWDMEIHLCEMLEYYLPPISESKILTK